MTAVITDFNTAISTLNSAVKISEKERFTRADTLLILQKVYSVRLSKADQQKLLDMVIQVRRSEGADRAFILNKARS